MNKILEKVKIFLFRYKLKGSNTFDSKLAVIINNLDLIKQINYLKIKKQTRINMFSPNMDTLYSRVYSAYESIKQVDFKYVVPTQQNTQPYIFEHYFTDDDDVILIMFESLNLYKELSFNYLNELKKLDVESSLGITYIRRHKTILKDIVELIEKSQGL